MPEEKAIHYAFQRLLILWILPREIFCNRLIICGYPAFAKPKDEFILLPGCHLLKSTHKITDCRFPVVQSLPEGGGIISITSTFLFFNWCLNDKVQDRENALVPRYTANFEKGKKAKPEVTLMIASSEGSRVNKPNFFLKKEMNLSCQRHSHESQHWSN